MGSRGPGGGQYFGSVAWARATGGILTTGQQVRLVGRGLRVAPQAFLRWAQAMVWRRRPSQGSLAFDWNLKPTGQLAELAERACRDALSEAMANHSFRTWAFGRALAEIDCVELDDELFFAAALLHDLGLASPTYRQCFTLEGAEKLMEIGGSCGADPGRVEQAADGITHHATPALTPAEGGLIGYYIQAGSLLDLSGTRAVDLPRDMAYQVSAVSWPLLGIKQEIGARWRAEAALVPGGRAQVLQRCFRFGSLARFTPLPPPPPKPSSAT